MKKSTLLLFSVSVIIFSCSLTSSVSEKTGKKLTGKWNISKIESSEFKMADAKSYGENLIRKMSIDSYFLFNADGTFRMQYGESEKNGNWTIINDGKNLVRYQNSVSDTLVIINLNKTNLILKGLKNNSQMTLELKKMKLK